MYCLLLFLIILSAVFDATNIEDKETVTEKNSNLVDDDSRIINGSTANPGQFPFMCSLQLHGKNGYYHFCGCTIINQHWALTAAHCIKNYVLGKEEDREDINCLYVVAGQNDARYKSDMNKSNTSQISAISAIFIHQQYGRRAFGGSDIALLELKKPVHYNQKVQPIELADAKFDPHNQWALIMGWGRTERTKKTSELQVSWTYVPKREECSEKWGELQLHELCIHNNQSNICFGDSGGPLVHKDKSGRYKQTGINSYVGNQACVGGAIVTSVSHFLPWIRDVMKGNYGKYNITIENE